MPGPYLPVSFPNVFASLAGEQPAGKLDTNFNLCAGLSDLNSLAAFVTDLPSINTPLAPTASGAVGVATDYAREDHAHPVQPATVNLQTGTTYTIQSSDNGKVIELSNAAAITLTVPNSLAASFSCLITQVGAGQVTIAPAVGATQRQASSLNKTRAQWAVVSLYVRANSGGTSAEYVLAGDMSS